MNMKAYIIAGVVRSGTNWLNDWLRQCGCGNPREWLNCGYGRKWFSGMWCGQKDGVLAVKIFWHHLVGMNQYQPGEYLNHYIGLMGDVRWVFVYRLDHLRQAISLCRVHAGGGWTQPARQRRREIDISYDPKMIDHNINYIRWQEENWRGYFDKRGIQPLTITYEDMITDMPKTVNRVIDHVGVGELRDVKSKLQKQSGEDVERIVRLYHEC